MRIHWIGWMVITLFFGVMSSVTEAKIMGRTVNYSDKGQYFEAFMAFDDRDDVPRAAILIFPQYMGITKHERKRAEQLARLGYTVLVADMYGRGQRPTTTARASALAKQLKSDRGLMRRRSQAALSVLAKQKWADPHLIGAIGYGLGGTVALELARSGADVKGVISFYGDLDTPTPDDAKNIKGSILIMHGANDPFVSWSQLDVFRREMQTAGCDWQLTIYGNAAHGFVQLPVKEYPTQTGVEYNKAADARSFKDMQRFFKEVLG